MMEGKDWVQIGISSGAFVTIISLLLYIIRLTNTRISNLRSDVKRDNEALSFQLQRTEDGMARNVKSVDEKLFGVIRGVEIRLGEANSKIETLNQYHVNHLASHDRGER